ncbi:MAG: DUF1553 domain-containing protein [Planctomycetes bacterium]|nr:DUF1553 domain-containing protein [Planctomycetota bacterium]
MTPDSRLRRCRTVSAKTLCIGLAAGLLMCLPAGRSLQAEEPLHVTIDRLIALQTADYDKIAAPVCSDEEFVRRIWLDLTGSVPPVAEARKFLADTAADKREKLVDQLLASPEYARHMARNFDLLLMRRLPQKHIPVAEWEKFLLDAFADNRPWDRIVREILTADGSDPATRGAARFYLDRDGAVDDITRDVGRIFLGADLQCAQCHNHPQIGDYKQPYYYGISAFFVRSFVMTDKEKRVVFAEKADGEAKFESAFEIRDKVSKGPRTTAPKLFDGLPISEPKFEKIEDAYAVKPDDKDKTVRPLPRFSRRAKFAEFIASAENRRFCRTTANRLWSMMLGRGIVHPVEFDHSDNPPSHPLLLAMLTEELAKNRLDVKAFIREIALSKTYQRSSRREGSDQGPAPDDAKFAVALLKPLSPAQLAWSMLQASGEIDAHRPGINPDALELDAELKAKVKAGQVEPDKQPLVNKAIEAEMYKKLVSYEQRFVQLFGGVPGSPPESFESTTDQVLFLANDPAIVGLVRPKTGNLAERLLKLPEDNPQQIAEELFLSALTRRPTAEDVQDVANYLAGQTGPARAAAVADLIWAALSASEFRFNH